MGRMSKFVVWKNIWEGEYVLTDEVVNSLDTVSFYLEGKLVKSYFKKDILKFYEVKE